MPKKPMVVARRLLIVFLGLAVAAMLMGLGLLALTVQRQTLSPDKPLTLWVRLIQASPKRLVVALAKTPLTTATPEAPKGKNGTAEQPLTVTLGPKTQLTADYYVGDVVSGTLMHTQPLRLEKLRAGVILKLVALPTGGTTLIAQTVSWPQSITSTGLAQPPLDIKIPPPISPP